MTDTDVAVLDTSISATAEAQTRPIVGEDYAKRDGSVSIAAKVVVECTCGQEVTVRSMQTGSTCQGCGRRWEM